MMRYRSEAAAGLALAALTFLAFSPTLDNGFVGYDDADYVTKNEHVLGGLRWAGAGWALTTGAASNWHPLTWVSLQADVTLFGPGPWGFHLTNLLLHCANAVLLFAALRLLTKALWPSALAAALFGLHPLRVESVAWVAERKDVLSGLFWMLGLLAYGWYAARPGWGRYLLVAAALAGSLLAKPMAVTFPFVLLLLDWWPLRRVPPAGPGPGGVRGAWRRWRGLVLEKAPLLALAAASCVVTLLAQRRALSGLSDVPPDYRLANAVRSAVAYLGLTVWPVSLGALYPYRDVAAWEWGGAALLLVLVSGAACWAAARGQPWFLVGWLWFLGTLVPVIGLVQVGRQALADRYTYLPSIGLAVLAVWGIAALAERWPALKAGRLGWGVLLGLLGLLSWAQTHYWHDPVLLWEHTLEVTGPDNPYAHLALAEALAERGDVEEAGQQYEAALAGAPAEPDVQFGAGVFLLKRGELAGATEHLAEAARLDPGSAAKQYDLATALLLQGRIEDAAAHSSRALEIDPNYAPAYFTLGLAAARQGQGERAVDQLRRAVALAPGDLNCRCALACNLCRVGRAEEARAEFREASRLDPDWPAGYDRTAWALATHPDARQRNGPRAIDLAETVCFATEAKQPLYLRTLAAADAEVGRWDRAEEAAGKALGLARSAGAAGLAAALEQQLGLARAHQPVRDAELGPP
jgi:tetratricopeptide (TPR) repeat protein